MGRSFRPCWGPGGRLVHAGSTAASSVAAAAMGRGAPVPPPAGHVAVEHLALGVGAGDVKSKRAALEVALSQSEHVPTAPTTPGGAVVANNHPGLKVPPPGFQSVNLMKSEKRNSLFPT